MKLITDKNQIAWIYKPWLHLWRQNAELPLAEFFYISQPEIPHTHDMPVVVLIDGNVASTADLVYEVDGDEPRLGVYIHPEPPANAVITLHHVTLKPVTAVEPQCSGF